VLAAAARLAWLASSRRRRAVERLVPGRVLARRSLFPQTNGFELTITVPGDPDTVAVLRVERDTDPAAALASAVELARAHGTELRALLACFDDVVGLYPDRRSPWVAAPLTKRSVADLASRVATWTTRRPVSVRVVPPGSVPPPPGGPLLHALTTRAVVLKAAPSHLVVVTDAGTTVYRGTDRVDPPD
jgi:hypothetical protein